MKIIKYQILIRSENIKNGTTSFPSKHKTNKIFIKKIVTGVDDIET